VARGSRAEVELHDGRVLEATVERRDPERDLAVLAVSAPGLEPAEIGEARALRPGQLVFALGTPLGVPRAVSAGIVHANGGRWVQADLRLAPGNSGGPLADASGRVVGINSMIVRGLALAIPSEAVERFLGNAERRPVLGVRIRPVAVAEGCHRRLGLLVLDIESGSLAEAAGLLPGDAIVESDRVPFTRVADLPASLRNVGPGETLLLGVIRGGTPVELRLVLSPVGEVAPA
jgi:serine protease Do